MIPVNRLQQTPDSLITLTEAGTSQRTATTTVRQIGPGSTPECVKQKTISAATATRKAI